MTLQPVERPRSAPCGTSRYVWGSPGEPNVDRCIGGWAYVLRGWRFGLAHSSGETGHPLAPESRPLEASCLVPGLGSEVLGDLAQWVVDTITSTGAPSTRRLYALNLFVDWCCSHQEDPRRCPVGVVLSFLQEGCFPPPWRCILPQLPHITMQLMVSLLVSTTW